MVSSKPGAAFFKHILTAIGVISYYRLALILASDRNRPISKVNLRIPGKDDENQMRVG